MRRIHFLWVAICYAPHVFSVIDNATWTNATTSGVWVTGSNWDTTVAPINPDDIANFTLSGNKTISLSSVAQDISIGQVLIGTSTGAYTFSSGTGTNTLIFDVSSGSATLSNTAAGGTKNFTCPIQLNDPLTITHASAGLTLFNATIARQTNLLSINQNGTNSVQVNQGITGDGDLQVTVTTGSNVLIQTANGISGNGGVTKLGTGTGTLRYSIANSYTGATNVQEGILAYNIDGGIPAASSTTVGTSSGNAATLSFGSTSSMTSPNAFALTINNTGTVTESATATAVYLKSLAGTDTSGNLALSAGATALTNITGTSGTNDSSYAGTITGGIPSSSTDPTSGNLLLKGGTSTLTLSGNSTYASRTFITQGVIAAQSNNALGIPGSSSPVFVTASGGTLGTLALSNNITLNKALNLNGAGYNNQGALHNTSGSNTVSGNVQIGVTTNVPAQDVTVQVDSGSTLTLSGTVSGANSLTKTGTGTLGLSGVTTLTGSGAVTVSNGQLNFLNTATIAGGVSVESGAAIGGTGPLHAPLTVSGTLSPGSSIGTMSVDSVTFVSGSIFNVELSASASDLLQVASAVDISNATLNLTPIGSLNFTENYTILTSPSVVGTFASVTGENNFPGYQFFINYFPTSVQILMRLVGFAGTIPTTGNAGAAVSGFLTIDVTNSDYGTVGNFLTSATTSQLQCDFDQMQSAMFNAIPIIQEATTVAVRSTVSERLDQVHGSYCLRSSANTRGLWVAPLANFSSQKSRSQGSSCDQTKLGFHSNVYGAAMGIDGEIDEIFVLGGALAYAHTNMHWCNKQARSKTNSGFASIYGSVFGDMAYFDFDATGAYGSQETTRNIYLVNPTGQLTRSAEHHNHAVEFDGYVNTGLTFHVPSAMIKPFISAEYIYIHENGYAESDASSLDLTVQKKNSNLLRAQGGLAASFCQHTDTMTWVEEIQVSYIREQRFQGRKTHMRFTDSPDYFIVSGFLPNRNLVAPEASLTAVFLEDFSLRAIYAGEFGNKWKTQTGSLEFLWKF